VKRSSRLTGLGFGLMTHREKSHKEREVKRSSPFTGFGFKTRLKATLGFLALSVIVAGCGATASNTVPAKTVVSKHLTPVTLAESTGLLAFAVSNVAEGKGFFADNGLDVSLAYDAGDTATDPAVMTGAAQFGIGTAPPLLKYQVLGEHPLLVAAINNQVDQQFIMSSATAHKLGITSGMSLEEMFSRMKGKSLKMATLDIGGTLQLDFNAVAAQYGLDPSTYTWTAIPSYPSILLALKTGEVDVASVGLPYGDIGVADGYAIMLCDLWSGGYSRYAGSDYSALFTTKAYATTHKAVVERMYRAIGEALSYMHAHPASAVSIIHAAIPGITTKILTRLLVAKHAVGFPTSPTISVKGFDVLRLAAAQTVDPTTESVTYKSIVWSGARAKGAR